MKTEEFDKKFDDGEDVTGHLDFSRAARPGREQQKRLIKSLDPLDDAETERLWVEEAERRYQAYKEGRLSARPAEEAVQYVQERLRFP